MKFSLAVGNWCQKIEHYMLLFLFLLSFFCLKQIWFYTYCSRQYWWMRRVCKKVKKNPEKERYWFNLSDVYTSGLTAKWHRFLSLSKFLFWDCNFTVIACQSHICAISKLNFDSQMQTTTEAPLRIRNGQNQLVMQMLQQRVTLLVSTKLASELVEV